MGLFTLATEGLLEEILYKSDDKNLRLLLSSRPRKQSAILFILYRFEDVNAIITWTFEVKFALKIN